MSLSLDSKGYPKLEEDKIDLAIYSPVDSDTGRGNPYHDPRTGKFTWAPPGNKIARGSNLIKNLSPPTRKLLFRRTNYFKSDTVAARVVNGQLHFVLLRAGKRVDSFAVDPIAVRNAKEKAAQDKGKPGEKPDTAETEGERGIAPPKIDDPTQRDIIFQVASNVGITGERIYEAVENQLGHELSPEQRAVIIEEVMDQRIQLLVAYLDLHFRRVIKGEKVSDAEFRIRMGRGQMKKTVAGLDEEHIKIVSQRLMGLGWKSEDIKGHFVKGLPKRLRDRPII